MKSEQAQQKEGDLAGDSRNKGELPEKHSTVLLAGLPVTPGHSIRKGRPGDGAIRVNRPLSLGILRTVGAS